MVDKLRANCILMKLLLKLTFLGALFLLSSIILHLWIHSSRPSISSVNVLIDDFSEKASLPSNHVDVIPMPASLHSDDQGEHILLNNFGLVSNIQILSNDLQLAIERYSRYLSLIGKISVKPYVVKATISTNELLMDCSTINFNQVDSYPHMGENEAYQLTINSTGSYLLSSSLTGFIRGLSTFVQLVQHDSDRDKTFVRYVQIIDQPRFVWRGLMIDVCRHWMPVEVIERTINAMEMSKMNVLHLHLSDDQGFRVQSHRHPLLHDRKNYFTQKDIQHLVEYARQRRIRIIPEFDIPGHTTSWFVGYPELASEVQKYELETRWGVSIPTMDPTKNTTYEFLDGFFEEMTKLFPDHYFHIGGDEVEGSQWRRSPAIQNFIFQHQLKNKNGLQAYFNMRVEKLLQKYRKILIGWEEIIEDPNDRFHLVPVSIIQSWKSPRSISEGVKQGYRSLRSHDYYLDFTKPASFYYQVDPIPEEYRTNLNDQQRKCILGGEACVWTEYLTHETIDRRIWPRVLSIAERFWSPSTLKDVHSLYVRLFRMGRILHEINIGLTHQSTYLAQLQALILDPKKKQALLHPMMILADACEPLGIDGRAQTGYYSSDVPLTTFNDVLRPESEWIWILETMEMNNRTFYNTFQAWFLNHVRLHSLFIEKKSHQKLWVQDVERLSKNLATVGEIGLRVLNYMSKGTLHSDQTNEMNQWTLKKWITHHQEILDLLRQEVPEIRLAAVRPVQRLLHSLR